MRAISVPLTLINLQDDGFHLLVEITLFKLKFYAVLDTGASRSVFDSSFIHKHISEYYDTQDKQATTLFSTSSALQATIPEIKIGSLKIENYESVGIDLQAVNQTYEDLGFPSIIGILGSDILLKYQAIINYKKLKLFLVKEPS